MKKGFEARKWSYRQTQEGIVVGLLIHPNDISAEIAMSSLGTHYMVALVKIGDNGKPEVEAPAPKKDRTPFGELSLSAQAAVRCSDPEFASWLRKTWPAPSMRDATTAELLRYVCAVTSRSEFNTDENAGYRWKQVESQFRMYQADMRYADSVNR